MKPVNLELTEFFRPSSNRGPAYTETIRTYKGQPFNFTLISVGDIVHVECDSGHGDAGSEKVVAINDDEIILDSGHRFSRKTGRAVTAPFAYSI